MGRRIHAQWPDSVVWGSILKQWHTAANRHGERPLSRRSGSSFNADVVRRRFCGLGLLVPRHAGARRHCPRILRHCSHCLWSNPLRRAGRITATPSGSITVFRLVRTTKEAVRIWRPLALCCACRRGSVRQGEHIVPNRTIEFCIFHFVFRKESALRHLEPLGEL